MRGARLAVVLAFLLVPYAARLPGGRDWLAQYTDMGWDGFLLIQLFNVIALGGLLLFSLLYRRPVSLVVPSVLGLGFLAWAHHGLDLAADAQSALALIFIPLYALLPIVIGGVAGIIVDARTRRRPPPLPPSSP